MSRNSPRRWLALVISILLITGLFFLGHEIVSLPERLLSQLSHESSDQIEKLRKILAEKFQIYPKIQVRDRVVVQPVRPVLDVTLLTRESELTRVMDETWLGSTKHLRLRARFRLHVGFDLSNSSEVVVRDRSLTVHLPTAKILSVEALGWNVDTLENGLWNKIDAADVQSELDFLRAEALRQGSPLPKEAEEAIRRELQDRLQPLGYQVTVRFDSIQTGAPLPSVSPDRSAIVP